MTVSILVGINVLKFSQVLYRSDQAEYPLQTVGPLHASQTGMNFVKVNQTNRLSDQTIFNSPPLNVEVSVLATTQRM